MPNSPNARSGAQKEPTPSRTTTAPEAPVRGPQARSRHSEVLAETWTLEKSGLSTSTSITFRAEYEDNGFPDFYSRELATVWNINEPEQYFRAKLAAAAPELFRALRDVLDSWDEPRPDVFERYEDLLVRLEKGE